uniref:DNA-directed DNA polymerase n=1 Tax=Meloidogyne hapla TaxID=6305 RepID=A0A1I8B827_MELHA
MTLASACLRHFCINYLKPDQIGIIPDNGYHRDTNQSAIALKFLKWLSHRTGVHIQHKESSEGEHRIIVSNGSVLRLDGFIKGNNGRHDIAIEFLGCAWHGHKCLYRPHEICLNGKTAMYNRDKLIERLRLLKAEGIIPIFVWECDVNKTLEEDSEMSLFFNALPDIGPLFPRDAFHGGRTGPLALKCDLEGVAEQTYEISCFDVVSLYPAVNFYAFYPIGHPEVVELNRNVCWTKPDDLHPYRGLFKLFIVPPDDLYLPVIPERIHGKLIFHLCHQCAIEIEPGVAKRTEDKYTKRLGNKWCSHTDKQRGFVSTTCSVELELALSRGYRVTKIYSIYHWKEWSDTLLRPYVQDMMRLKIEASGWPSSVMTECSKEEKKLKQAFIDRNQKEYGIELAPSRINKNDGMRYLAKTCNNSMWGRWALRCNLTQDCITSSPVKLHTVLNDPKLELGAVEMLAQNLYAVPYRKRKEFVRPHEKYNIAIALITTATARVMLYDFMEKIVKEKDCKLLYTDTDSCFYLHKRQHNPPFKVGDMLGMMGREYEDWTIIAFYAGGCKQVRYIIYVIHFYLVCYEDGA